MMKPMMKPEDRKVINVLPKVGYAEITSGAMWNAREEIDGSTTKYAPILIVDKVIEQLEKEEADGSLYDYRYELLQLCRDARRVGLEHIIVYIENGKEMLFPE